MGNMNKHLKLQFTKDKQTLEGIGFGMGELSSSIASESPISVVGELGINEWNGFRKVQIVMKDIRIDTWQLFDYRGKNSKIILDDMPAEESLVIATGNHVPENVSNVFSYTNALEYSGHVQALYLYELPKKLQDLKTVVDHFQPSRIYACFHIAESAYLSGFPPRDAFKWFYGYVLKKGEVDLKQELAQLMKHKGWTKDWVVFMASVFRDLDFIEINNSVIRPLPEPAKKPLDESKVYQERVEQTEVEKTLYYANYTELKNWFDENCTLAEGQSERKFAYGL